MDYFNQTSERLYYRKIEEEDIERWEAFFVDNEQLAFVGVTNDKPPLELSKTWVTTRIERYNTESFGLLSAVHKETGALIGMAGIIPTPLDGKTYLQIGYSVIPAYWNTGYATETALQMLNYAKEHVQPSKLIAIINLENTHSVRIAEKMGMYLWKRINYKGSDVNVYALDCG